MFKQIVLKLVILFLIVMWGSGSLQAQIVRDSVDFFSTDTVKTTAAQGLAGDTINVPLLIKHNSPVGALQIYIEYDTTYLDPVIAFTDTLFDTVFIITQIDTMIDVPVPGDTTFDTIGFFQYDTVGTDYFDFDFLDTAVSLTPAEYNTAFLPPSLVQEQDFPTGNSHKRMIFAILPVSGLIDTRNAFLPGRHEIALLKFAITNNAVEGSHTDISFYKEILFSDSIPPVQLGCIFSQYYDSTGTTTHRLKGGASVVNFAPAPIPPVINFFTANPDTIYTGESSLLEWDVFNATTISINQGVGTVTGPTGSTSVSPASSRTYTLTATNGDGSTIATAPIIVLVAPPNLKPVFNSPTQTAYSVEQGQTLSFAVNATDGDGDNITLTASNLPFNATFGPTNPVVGGPDVTGNFSFTPDYNQLGIVTATFSASDGKPNGTQTLVVSIEVTELEFDRLFTTSAPGQKPQGGLPGSDMVLVPINLISAQDVYGIQFDFLYDNQYFSVDSILTTPRTPDWIIYDNINQTPGNVRIVSFGVANEPVLSDTLTAVFYIAMTIDSSAPPGSYPLYIENGWESNTPDPDFPSLPLVTDSGIIQVDFLGDVNLDGRVDVADAVNVVGYILGDYTFTSRQFDAGDVNVDLTIDVVDLVAIINIIFGIPPVPVSGYFVSNEMAKVSMIFPDLQPNTPDMLTIRAELPEQIAGVQLEVRYNPLHVNFGVPQRGSDASYMVLSSRDNHSGKLTVLLYFKNPYRSEELIQSGEVELLQVPIVANEYIDHFAQSHFKLTDARLSTPEALSVQVEGIDEALPTEFSLSQNYPNPFNPTTTIEFAIGASSSGALIQQVKLEIYNILGQRVTTLVDDKLQPGQYNVEWDATNSGGKKVASGIYLYRLQVDEATKSKKMVLLK